MKRITKTTHTRPYRYSKKNPRAFKQVTIYDLGNVEQQTHLSFKKENLLKHDIETEKTLNPDLFTVRIGDSRLAFYYKDDKGFIYDSNGFLSGRFDSFDLKRAFLKIGLVLKKISSVKTRNILRRNNRLKKVRNLERDNRGRFKK